MKRLRRWLFNGLSLVSLLLCLAIIVVWIRSHWAGDALIFDVNLATSSQMQRIEGMVESANGEIEVFGDYGFAPPDPAAVSFDFRFEHGWPNNFWMLIFNPTLLHRAGFLFYSAPGSGFVDHAPVTRSVQFVFTFPTWIPMALLFALPIWRWIVPRFRGRKIPGFCAACGYDLRATPDRCPECGTIPAKPINSI
jgi:hypothetical protein